MTVNLIAESPRKNGNNSKTTFVIFQFWIILFDFYYTNSIFFVAIPLRFHEFILEELICGS